MNRFALPVTILLAVAVVSRVAAVRAADDPGTKEGILVSIKMGQLVLTEAAGKQATLHVADAVQVMINGKPAKLMDLKKGTQIRVKLNVEGDAILIMTIDENIK